MLFLLYAPSLAGDGPGAYVKRGLGVGCTYTELFPTPKGLVGLVEELTLSDKARWSGGSPGGAHLLRSPVNYVTQKASMLQGTVV